jgi:hypothetical protein
VRVGARAGTDNELVVVSRDPLGKRCVCRCSACARTFVVGAGALVGGGVHCGCAPLSAKQRTALQSDRHDLVARRQQQDWRPGRPFRVRRNGPDAGDDKIGINSSSLDHLVVILADQSLEIVEIAKTLYRTEVDRHGRGGLRAGAKVTVSRDSVT